MLAGIGHLVPMLALGGSGFVFVFVFKLIYVEKERLRVQDGDREKKRERIPIRLSTVSSEPSVGLMRTHENLEIMT